MLVITWIEVYSFSWCRCRWSPPIIKACVTACVEDAMAEIAAVLSAEVVQEAAEDATAAEVEAKSLKLLETHP